MMTIKIMSEKEEGQRASAHVNHSTSVNKIIHAVIPTMIRLQFNLKNTTIIA